MLINLEDSLYFETNIITSFSGKLAGEYPLEIKEKLKEEPQSFTKLCSVLERSASIAKKSKGFELNEINLFCMDGKFYYYLVFIDKIRYDDMGYTCNKIDIRADLITGELSTEKLKVRERDGF